MTKHITAPFPWFGGKSKAASLIWSRLGSDCGNYVEPFLGSCAVYLRRPAAFSGWVTLNDLDGHVVNFWRSVTLRPEETALAACNPVFEADLHARHLRLVREHGRLAERLAADPLHCEPTLAGWWAWGACVWIGGGWCDGTGPWGAGVGDDGLEILTRNGGTGINRQLPHLGDGGTGINRKPEGDRLAWVNEWFSDLSESLRDARVACGSWERIMSPDTMTRNGVCAVVLDPPYSQTEAVYAQDSSSIAHDARAWCVTNGANPALRIALCGHEGEHNELQGIGWSVATWEKSGGYQGADNRERIWFSPACVNLRNLESQGTLQL